MTGAGAWRTGASAHAAGSEDDVPGDPACVVGGQEGHQRAVVVGGARTARGGGDAVWRRAWLR